MSKIELVENKVVYKGWMSLSVARIRLANGQIMKREVLKRGPAAAVLPYDAERRTAILVRQLRAPAYIETGDEAMLETIAGMLDHDGDDVRETVRREAIEEAGLRVDALEFMAEVWSSPGIVDERVALFLAPYRPSDRIGAGGGLAEEHEQIEVVEMPLAELAALADRGEITDMKTFALVQTLRLRKPELFGPAP